MRDRPGPLPWAFCACNTFPNGEDHVRFHPTSSRSRAPASVRQHGRILGMRTCNLMGEVDLPENTIHCRRRCTLSAHEFLEHEPGCDTKLGSAGSQQGRVESWSRQSFYRSQKGSITWIRFGPIRRALRNSWLDWPTRLRFGSNWSKETSESSTVHPRLRCMGVLYRFRFATAVRY